MGATVRRCLPEFVFAEQEQLGQVFGLEGCENLGREKHLRNREPTTKPTTGPTTEPTTEPTIIRANNKTWLFRSRGSGAPGKKHHKVANKLHHRIARQSVSKVKPGRADKWAHIWRWRLARLRFTLTGTKHGNVGLYIWSRVRGRPPSCLVTSCAASASSLVRLLLCAIASRNLAPSSTPNSFTSRPSSMGRVATRASLVVTRTAPCLEAGQPLSSASWLSTLSNISNHLAASLGQYAMFLQVWGPLRLTRLLQPKQKEDHVFLV